MRGAVPARSLPLRRSPARPPLSAGGRGARHRPRPRLHRSLRPLGRLRADRRHQGHEPDPPAAHVLSYRGLQDSRSSDRADRGELHHRSLSHAFPLGCAPVTGARRVIALLLLAGVFVLEGYDLNAMALAVPRLKGALGLEPAAFGAVFAVLPLGIGVGGALLAPLGDRIGRRPLIVFGCVGVAASMLATALAGSIPAFVGWRLLNGIMLGACLPNVSALSADLAPERLRATIMSVVAAGIPIGLAGAGLTTPSIVAVAGWQGLFVVP